MRSTLARGDLAPRIVVPPPGPRSRALARRLERAEAPAVNTLYRGEASLVWRAARGANVLDVDGNRYVDLTSGFGVAAIGHRHPRVVAAVAAASRELLHGLGDVAAHPRRLALAERLAALAPVDEPQVYFAISGADAIEIALKSALLSTGRPGFLAFEPGYHGLTLGALAATSRREFRRPFAAHLHRRVRRLPFGCPLEQVAQALAAAPALGAVVVEPIVGREGVLLPPRGWLAEVARLARRAGALFVADEIFTGFGRSGRLFAVEREGVRPDLLCCGKALGGGLPIAAVVGRTAVLSAWPGDGEALHTATFLAHPLACAAALATLRVIESERLPQRAAALGRRIGPRLRHWPRRFACVRAVRGLGALWGVELRDRRAAAAAVTAAARRGILWLAGGPEGRVAQLVPPLTITEPQLDTALDLLEESLAEVAAGGEAVARSSRGSSEARPGWSRAAAAAAAWPKRRREPVSR